MSSPTAAHSIKINLIQFINFISLRHTSQQQQAARDLELLRHVDYSSKIALIHEYNWKLNGTFMRFLNRNSMFGPGEL